MAPARASADEPTIEADDSQIEDLIKIGAAAERPRGQRRHAAALGARGPRQLRAARQPALHRRRRALPDSCESAARRRYECAQQAAGNGRRGQARHRHGPDRHGLRPLPDRLADVARGGRRSRTEARRHRHGRRQGDDRDRRDAVTPGLAACGPPDPRSAPSARAAGRRRRGGPILTGPMSKVCHVCAKGPSFGNSRSHSMVATKRRFDPNLQRVRIDDGGTPRRVYVCTRCLKAGKVTKAR